MFIESNQHVWDANRLIVFHNVIEWPFLLFNDL